MNSKLQLNWLLVILTVALLTIVVGFKKSLVEKYWTNHPMLSTGQNYFPGSDLQYYPGTTRNMSRDLRGDIYIPRQHASPWNNPDSYPIQNRPLVMGW